MRVSPVSFGSLHVFTLNDGRPKADVPTLVKGAFDNNERLSNYKLQSKNIYRKKFDGTIHNANSIVADKLDNEYRGSVIPKDSNKVMLSEVIFYVNPQDTEKRYFITAASRKDENRIHEILNNGGYLYSVRYSPLMD